MADEVKKLAEEYAINIVTKYGKPLYDQWGQNRVKSLDTIRTELIHRVASEEFFPEAGPDYNELRWKLDDKLPDLDIELPLKDDLPPWRYGIAAAVGVILGIISIGSLLRLAGLDTTSGFFFSALVGAALMTGLFSYVSKSSFIRKSITVALGVATITELWTVFVPSVSWKHFLTQQGREKRLLSYLLIAIYLWMSKPAKIEPDEKLSEEVARKTLRVWLEYAFHLSKEHIADKNSSGKNIYDELPISLIEKLYKLHRAPKDELELASIELLQEARMAGLDGLESPPAFQGTNDNKSSEILIWEPHMYDLYDIYGVVEEGNSVIVEDRPIIISGEVRKKGLVRKTQRELM